VNPQSPNPILDRTGAGEPADVPPGPAAAESAESPSATTSSATTSAEAAPTETTQADSKAADSTTADSKQADTKTAATKPAAPAKSAAPPRAQSIDPREHHVFLSRKSGAPKMCDYIPQLWARREFVYELARCTLRAQNYLNAFGQLWLVLNPLLLGCVYFVLVDIIDNSKHAPNYFTVLLGGLFLYNFFSGTLSQSAGSIIGSSRLVLNSRLPRLVLPITQIFIAFMRFLPSMLVFLIVHTIQDQHWGLAAFYAIPAFLEMAMFGAGLGFVCATLQVYFRDFANLLPYVTRIWLFLSPVLWSLGTIDSERHGLKYHVISLNPLSPIIGTWGDALVYNQAPPYSWLLQGLAWGVGALVLGVLVFTRREREFSVRL
jgi:teichoic acid transport system permease protein